jgi:hypothetical protein
MLGLTLRPEFRSKRISGTMIELSNAQKTGATQRPAAEFLEISYPTSDLLAAVEAIGPKNDRPVVFIGERGQGKSHLMAVLYHALTDQTAMQAWLNTWSSRLQYPKMATLPLRQGMHVITESLVHQNYKFLWDLLLERHPHGAYIRGKWEGQGAGKTDILSYDLTLELLQKQSTALILDEYQTWFDGLTNTKQYPWKQWAFNFIQILSEIAKSHPELLLLVVSVRNGNTDAYQQIHRVDPARIDFKGPYARRDRQRLLLHRLFENRLQISPASIESLAAAHVSEHLRLSQAPASEHAEIQRTFVDAWPFSPQLLQLLEDQVLVATSAQETRDLILILANLFKQRGEKSPVLTAADFPIDDEQNAIGALLDSVSNQHHNVLREKAIRNLEQVREILPPAEVPHLDEIMSALWLRSLAVEKLAGAEPATIQTDITRGVALDDNAFQVELLNIADNSFNIHEVNARFVFLEPENRRAKLMSFARNDKLFKDGEDLTQLALETRYVIGGAGDAPNKFRVIVLRGDWLKKPWEELDLTEHPDQWDGRIPILVLPEEPEELHSRLGEWLKTNVPRLRNTLRFLIPKAGSENAFLDRNLIILARAIVKADEWKKEDNEYVKLHSKYQTDLRAILKIRFDRYAILDTWNFQEPKKCRFHIENHGAQGGRIPEAIDESVRQNLFVPEEFEDLVMAHAKNSETVHKLILELREPRPNQAACIPWLGDVEAKERLVRVCAKGKIAINIRGFEFLQAKPGEESDQAYNRMKSKLPSGKHLEETWILLPDAVPAAGGYQPPLPTPTQGGATPVQPPTTGSLFPTTPFNDPPDGHEVDDGAEPDPGSIFGGPAPSPLVTCHAPATSALNLLGKTESWGVGPATSVKNVNLKVSQVTGAQLQKLLKSLPDGISYELDLDKESS